jgi:hypothetical protein
MKEKNKYESTGMVSPGNGVRALMNMRKNSKPTSAGLRRQSGKPSTAGL